MIKNIMIFTPKMEIGGAEKYILKKSFHLINKGYKVFVVSAGGKWTHKVEELGGRHITIDFLDTDPKVFKRKEREQKIEQLSLLLTIFEIDIIEAHQFNPIVWAIELSKKTNVAFMCNMLSGRIFYEKNRYYFNYLNELSRKNILYDTEGSSSTIERRRKIKLYNSIKIPILTEHKKTLQPSQNYNESEYILTVSRLTKDKLYVFSLMREFKNLIKNNNLHSLNLKIVGDGPYYKKIEKLAKKLNSEIKKNNCSIILLGNKFDDDLERLYSNTKVYIGMGTTVLDVARYNKPIILATPEYRYNHKSVGYFGFNNMSIGFLGSSNTLDTYYNALKNIVFNKDFEKKLGMGSNLALEKYYNNFEIISKWEYEYNKVFEYFKVNNFNINIHVNKVQLIFVYLKKLRYKLNKLRRCKK